MDNQIFKVIHLNVLIYLTEEISIEVERKFKDIALIEKQIQSEFDNKFYGEDLTVVYISLLCNSPRFESFFRERRPNYKSEHKVYIHRGVKIERKGKSLSYDLKLDYEIYANAFDVKGLLARDIIKSLDVINTIKRIKEFDFYEFKTDFESILQRSNLI